MAGNLTRFKLKSWRWPKNNGLILHYEDGMGTKAQRFEPPNGLVKIADAAYILGVADVFLYRRHRRKALEAVTRKGQLMVPVSEILRLRREFEGKDTKAAS